MNASNYGALSIYDVKHTNDPPLLTRGALPEVKKREAHGYGWVSGTLLQCMDYSDASVWLPPLSVYPEAMYFFSGHYAEFTEPEGLLAGSHVAIRSRRRLVFSRGKLGPSHMPPLSRRLRLGCGSSGGCTRGLALRARRRPACAGHVSGEPVLMRSDSRKREYRRISWDVDSGNQGILGPRTPGSGITNL